jgi:putative transposase
MAEKDATPDSRELPDVSRDILLQAIPAKTSAMGRPIEVDFRKILRGIFFVLRTGIQWRAVPREKFGPPSTVYYYFSKWRREGVFAAMAARAPEV